ncbi:orotidine-5'-phosphate decarboxylase [Guggenheimella bovis]
MKKLFDAMKKKNSAVCVGIDPNLTSFPEDFYKDASIEERLTQFSKCIIDATEEYAACYKVQIAYFEQYGLEGMKAFKNVLDYGKEKGVFMISDVKRGDIGSTAEAYARAFLGRTGDFSSDAITVNPYLGDDNNEAFYKLAKENEKGVFVLVKTSNPTSSQLQNLECNGKLIFEHVSEMVLNHPLYSDDLIGCVVGATHPRELEFLRKKMPTTLFLVPGYGAQGGTSEDLKAAFGEDGLRAIVNSSRGILYAYKKNGLPLGEATREAARAMRDDLNGVRNAL